MSTALNKITKLASGDSYKWFDEAFERQTRKTWSDRSFKIAVRILREIRHQKEINGMTQKKLAELMDVSPQYINKVIKGKENLTLETISKIEQVLNIVLIEIPSIECAGQISYEPLQVLSNLKRSESVFICENEIDYNMISFIKATGTNG
jgi:transcriptional regulator with XRE-family HTH domain